MKRVLNIGYILFLETNLLNLQNQLQITTDNRLTSCSNELSSVYLNMSAIHKYNTKRETDLLSQKQNMTNIQDSLQNCSTFLKQSQHNLSNLTEYLEKSLLNFQDQLQSTTDNLTSRSIQLFDTQNYQSNNRYIIKYYLYFVKIYTLFKVHIIFFSRCDSIVKISKDIFILQTGAIFT